MNLSDLNLLPMLSPETRRALLRMINLLAAKGEVHFTTDPQGNTHAHRNPEPLNAPKTNQPLRSRP